MAMATGGAGASALIMALNSAKTVKSTKAMLDNTKELNKAMENGALQSFNQMLSGLQNTGPIQSAFSVLFAQIQAGTMQSTVGLMNDMLTLFMSPGGQATINACSELINILVDGAATIIRIIDKILDLFHNEDVVGTSGAGPGTPGGMADPTGTGDFGNIAYTPTYVPITYRPGIQEYG